MARPRCQRGAGPENEEADKIPISFSSFVVLMTSTAFSWITRQWLLTCLFLLLAGNIEICAQQKLAARTDALRRDLNWPSFDSLLRLNPVQRCILVENTRIKSIPDRSVFVQLTSGFRKYAEERENKDALLLADLMDYIGFSLENPFGSRMPLHIAYLEKLHLKAGREDVRWFKEEVDLMLASAYVADIRNYESGLFLLRELVALPEADKESDSPLRRHILIVLGSAYTSFNDPSRGLYYFRRSLSTPVPPGMEGERTEAILLNNLGFCFKELRQLDSSDYYFRKELALCRSNGDSIYEHITLGNLGENQYLRGNYDAALPLLQADYSMARKVGDIALSANALMLIGDIYSRKGEYIRADSLLHKGLYFTRFTKYYPRKKKAFPIMARYYLKTGKPELAALYMDSSHIVADSLVRLNNRSKVSSVEADFAYQNLKMKSILERSALELSNQRRNAGILILILLIIIGFLYFLRNRASARAREAELRLLQQNTEQELLSAREQLHTYISKLTEAPLESVEWLNSSLHTGLHMHQFLELFSQSFPGFIQRLKAAFAGLSENEIRFCCLERLNLSTKEKAVILGINENSVHKTQSRLRTKLGLSKEDSLSIILSDI